MLINRKNGTKEREIFIELDKVGEAELDEHPSTRKKTRKEYKDDGTTIGDRNKDSEG